MTLDEYEELIQTPVWLARHIVKLSKQFNPKIILEPTPGKGNIINSIKEEYGESIKTVYPEGDFFQLPIQSCDCCIANPPFMGNGKIVEFVNRMFQFTDNLILIIPAYLLINSVDRTNSFIGKGLKEVILIPRSAFPKIRTQCFILVIDGAYRGGYRSAHYPLLKNKIKNN